MIPQGLSARQKAFAEAYAADAEGVGWRAAEAAGYQGARPMLASRASKLLANGKVREYIAFLQADAMRKAKVDAGEVVQRLANIARANPLELVETAENTDPVVIQTLEDLPPGGLDGIKEIRKLPEGKGYRVTFHGLKLRRLEDLPEQVRDAVSEISVTKHGRVSVKLHDKIAALSRLGQHLGLFVERHRLEGDQKNPVRLYLPHNNRRKGPAGEGGEQG